MKISNYKLQGDKCEIANIKRKFLIKPKKKKKKKKVLSTASLKK